MIPSCSWFNFVEGGCATTKSPLLNEPEGCRQIMSAPCIFLLQVLPALVWCNPVHPICKRDMKA